MAFFSSSRCGVMGINVNDGLGQIACSAAPDVYAVFNCRSAPAATRHRSTSLSARA